MYSKRDPTDPSPDRKWRHESRFGIKTDETSTCTYAAIRVPTAVDRRLIWSGDSWAPGRNSGSDGKGSYCCRACSCCRIPGGESSFLGARLRNSITESALFAVYKLYTTIRIIVFVTLLFAHHCRMSYRMAWLAVDRWVAELSNLSPALAQLQPPRRRAARPLERKGCIRGCAMQSMFALYTAANEQSSN